ncbi:MAG: alpha/beta hydrolase [Gammaproteobacteria bacterium]|nr:alpha/beta hydrolase [Gammaproteobacteria bacterium]
MSLEYLELVIGSNPDASIIWLHGLGADGHDFEAMVPELNLPDSCNIRFIFPHAPFRPITLNNGYMMRGWYDIQSLEFGKQEDRAGIEESEQQLLDLINNEITRGIPAERIILAGFSQGGAIILYTGLRYKKPLAGLLALSTYLPLADSLPEQSRPANKSTPLFMAHGTDDNIVNYLYGVQTRQALLQQGYTIEWHDYPMAHSVCMDEIAHIRDWIVNTLSIQN